VGGEDGGGEDGGGEDGGGEDGGGEGMIGVEKLTFVIWSALEFEDC